MKKRTSISDKGPPGLSDKTLRLSRSTKVQPGRLTRDYTDAVGRIDFRAGKKTRILRFQLIIDVRGQTGWFWYVIVSRYMTGWHFRVIWPWNDLQKTFDCTMCMTRSFSLKYLSSQLQVQSGINSMLLYQKNATTENIANWDIFLRDLDFKKCHIRIDLYKESGIIKQTLA